MRRWGSIFLTAFMTLWLGVIVPGHQRGQIMLGARPSTATPVGGKALERPGDAMSIAAGESCCRPTAESPAEASEYHGAASKTPLMPKPRSGGLCAVCAFRLSLDIAVAFVFILPDIGLVQLLDEQRQLAPMLTCHVSPAMIRGPPTGLGLSC